MTPAWHTLLVYRVSAVILAAVVALALLELLALLVVSRRAPWVVKTWQFYAVHPFTGDDGRLSYTKLFAVFLAALYALGASIPASVGVALITASFGAKIFLALIEAWAGKSQPPEIADTPPPPSGHAG